MMNKVIKDILIEICKKLEGEIEIKNDFYKQFHILLNFLNKKINTIYYLYDHNLILLWTNGKNTRIINKSLEDLREVGYDKFTEGYHPDNKVINEQRKWLLETGEAFEIPVKYKNNRGEYEDFIVFNTLINPEAIDEDKLYFGETRSLKNLNDKLENDEIKYKLNSKEYFDDVFSELTECQCKVLWTIYKNCDTNKKTADANFVSLNTIKTHKYEIFHILKVKNTAQLIKLITTRLLFPNDNKKQEKT